MVQQTLFKKPKSFSSSLKATSIIRRRETVFKKASELSILCGIEVCVIYYGPDGLKTWPEDMKMVKAMAQRYWDLSETKRRKRSVSLQEFLEKMDEDDSKKKTKKKGTRVAKVKYPDWDPRFDHYYVEQLTRLIQSLERVLITIQRRFHAVVEGQRQREKQNRNMGNQEFMNHLLQQSNQVSVVPCNHVNGNISQNPVSASALDQGQSLAPIPPELMVYPNWDVGNYSSSLGVQVTGINGFQNRNMSMSMATNMSMSMATNMNMNMNMTSNMYSRNNFNVEGYNNSYSVNANSLPHQLVPYSTQQHYNNNYSVNADSLSHQLVQYPTQEHYNYSVNANSLSDQFVQYSTQQQQWAFN